MIAALEQAITSAETLLGRLLLSDCVDAATGETEPLVIVTDNGPAMRSIAVARWFNARPHLRHVRTRHKAPETNGVIERWFGSLKYERLYRHDIADGLVLGELVADFLDEFNRLRPHEAISWQRPLDRYLQPPEPSNPTDPQPEQEP